MDFISKIKQLGIGSIYGNGTQAVDAGMVGATGPDQISNGDFASDSIWTKNSSTISGGKGHTSGNGSYLRQPITMLAGHVYRITYTASNVVGENRIMPLTNWSVWTVSEGTHTLEDYTAHGDETLIHLDSTTGGSCDWDDISLVEVFGVPDVAPDHFAMEVTNTQSYESPEINLVAGSLPVNSLICVSYVGALGDWALVITSSGNPVRLSAADNEAVMFIKSSIGWLPITGQQEPS
jgi:hypothetical protein